MIICPFLKNFCPRIVIALSFSLTQFYLYILLLHLETAYKVTNLLPMAEHSKPVSFPPWRGLHHRLPPSCPCGGVVSQPDMNCHPWTSLHYSRIPFPSLCWLPSFLILQIPLFLFTRSLHSMSSPAFWERGHGWHIFLDFEGLNISSCSAFTPG